MDKGNKKGALELSVNTIVVIVIGVTLLTLGLLFVRGLFGKITTLTDETFRRAEIEIQERMGTDQKFYVSGNTIEIESGKSTTVTTGVQNFGEEGAKNKFSLDIEIGPQGGNENWFTLPPAVEVGVGNKKPLPFAITLPKGIEPGQSFTFTVKALKDNIEYDSQVIIVRVKE